MNQLRNLLSIDAEQLNIIDFSIRLFWAFALSFLLSKSYVKFGRSLSNRKEFAENFIIISTTTMIIINLIKSSLALSLGLVGALSIVRFRAAIKEPEELSYLFLAVCIGLGTGASQQYVTATGILIILFIIFSKNKFKEDTKSQNLYISISGRNDSDIFAIILEKVKKHTNLKIMELKYDAKYDFDARELMQHFPFRLSKFSKYIRH